MSSPSPLEQWLRRAGQRGETGSSAKPIRIVLLALALAFTGFVSTASQAGPFPNGTVVEFSAQNYQLLTYSEQTPDAAHTMVTPIHSTDQNFVGLTDFAMAQNGLMYVAAGGGQTSMGWLAVGGGVAEIQPLSPQDLAH